MCCCAHTTTRISRHADKNYEKQHHTNRRQTNPRLLMQRFAMCSCLRYTNGMFPSSVEASMVIGTPGILNHSLWLRVMSWYGLRVRNRHKWQNGQFSCWRCVLSAYIDSHLKNRKISSSSIHKTCNTYALPTMLRTTVRQVKYRVNSNAHTSAKFRWLNSLGGNVTSVDTSTRQVPHTHAIYTM